MASWLRPWVLTAGLVAALVGCKQGVGEYCQLATDCKGGLVCNPTIMVCEEPGGTPVTPDAAPTPDAPAVPDATPVVDSAVAAPDAAGPVDAPAAAPDAPAAAPDATP